MLLLSWCFYFAKKKKNETKKMQLYSQLDCLDCQCRYYENIALKNQCLLLRVLTSRKAVKLLVKNKNLCHQKISLWAFKRG